MKFTKYLLLSLCLAGHIALLAKEFTPIVTQFGKQDYAAGSQNWSVCQDSKGFMYFGNNVGLLRFDGMEFTLLKMPNEQIVRAVYIDKNDRIYVGSFREFGYFEKDKFGVLNYTSLANQLSEYKLENDEIWKITEFQGKILFQSFKSIFIFDGKQTEGKLYDETFLFLQPFNGQLYAHTLQYGFCRFDVNEKRFVKLPDTPFASAVIAIVPFSDSEAYIATQSEGIFIFDGRQFRKFSDSGLSNLQSANVNKAILTKDSMLVVGTILDGITAIDKHGKKVWTLNTTNDLQNNTVLGMFCDNDNNLWLALDKGISVVQLDKPIRVIRSFSPSVGSIYSLHYRHPDVLYVATNQGLYSGKLSLNDHSLAPLQLDPVIKGQVWTLAQFDDQLFCGSNEETYEIYPRRGAIAPARGGMCMDRGTIHGREAIVQGTYSDICIYTKTNEGRWRFFSTVRGFLNPVKSIVVDYQGRIWAAHMHQGLYLIELKADLTTIKAIKDYSGSDIFKSQRINVFSVENRIVFSDNFRFYLFDDINNRIVPYEALNKALGIYAGANRVVRQCASKYWFIRDDCAWLVDLADDDKVELLDKVRFSLFQNQTVDDYQNVVPITENAALFTLENGIALYRLEQGFASSLRAAYEIQLTEVLVEDKDSEEKMLLPIDSDAGNIAFSYTKNRIRFKVSFPDFYYHDDVMFRYKMSGLDDHWSEKTLLNTKEYSYLAPGNYEFSVQALTKGGEVIADRTYAFYVCPPFYLTTFAKVVYGFIAILVLYFSFYLIKRIFEQKKRKILQEEENIRRTEIEKREMEIVALKADKLEADLTLKSKELAMFAMTIIRKNEAFLKVKEELTQLKNYLGVEGSNKYYERMKRILDQNITSDNDWMVFQTNFDRIHENFFRNLHEKYPELTPNDLRFCAYFRLNLPTKDIAQLMNISVKGVEVARYRIRKKINIPSEKNITEFMIEFK